MTTAICRYGARVVPDTRQIIAEHRRRGTLVQGPEVAAFEDALATRLGVARVTAASYGRMAFYYLLRALDLPAGSEIILPALTFWAVPEMARAAGLIPVFADVDPTTFNLDVHAAERCITGQTRAIVPTHLYGLPCDMDAVEHLAQAHGLRVIEDCAHALGATYRGRPVGTFGDAAFFSFQTLKPLNTYRGGAAVAQSPAVAARVAALAASEPWPTEAEVNRLLLMGTAQRVFTRSTVFTWTMFPILWAASWLDARPDVDLWEAIRPLTPLPASYTRRYANVQAALGLAGLEHLSAWTAAARAHAARMDRAFARVPGITVPSVPADREHVYYQYGVYVADRPQLVTWCLRHGVDVETLHMDVCPRLTLFGTPRPAPGADRAAESVQLPIHPSLTDAEVERVIDVVSRALGQSPRPLAGSSARRAA